MVASKLNWWKDGDWYLRTEGTLENPSKLLAYVYKPLSAGGYRGHILETEETLTGKSAAELRRLIYEKVRDV